MVVNDNFISISPAKKNQRTGSARTTSFLKKRNVGTQSVHTIFFGTITDGSTHSMYNLKISNIHVALHYKQMDFDILQMCQAIELK